MAMYRITLWGLYNYDTTLFDKMQFPDGADKQNFIDSLMLSYGSCEPLFPDPDFMKNIAIPAWYDKWSRSIEQVFNVFDKLDYEPLENYDRNEEWTDRPDITRVNKQTGQDIADQTAGQGSVTSQSGTDTSEDKVSAYNSSGYDPSNQNTMKYGNSTTVQTNGTNTNTFKYGKIDTNTEHGTNTHKGRIHGNIGITTSQQMAQSELDFRKQSFIDYCTGLFAHDMLLLVY